MLRNPYSDVVCSRLSTDVIQSRRVHFAHLSGVGNGMVRGAVQ